MKNLQVEKLTSWETYKLRNLQVEKLTSWETYKLRNLQVEKLTSWETYKMRNLQVEKLTSWETYKLRNLLVEKHKSYKQKFFLSVRGFSLISWLLISVSSGGFFWNLSSKKKCFRIPQNALVSKKNKIHYRGLLILTKITLSKS